MLGKSLHFAVPSAIYLQLAEAMRNQDQPDWIAVLGFAIRSGKAVLGLAAVESAAKRGDLRLIVMHPDAGSNTRNRLDRIGRTARIPVLRHSALDSLTGDSTCKCLGVTDVRFFETITRMTDERRK